MNLPRLRIVGRRYACRPASRIYGTELTSERQPPRDLAALPRSWTLPRGLLEELIEHALKLGAITEDIADELRNLLERDRFMMAAEELKYRVPEDAYHRFLIDRFQLEDIEPAPIQLAIFKLNAPLIITTNYDSMLEDSYSYEYRKGAWMHTYEDAPDVANFLPQADAARHPLIWKIHGTIQNPAKVILSERDYRRLLYNQPGYREVLAAIFLTKVVLILGFSFDDYELRTVLGEMRNALAYRSEPDFIFIPKNEVGQVVRHRFHEDYGVAVIPYEPGPDGSEVAQFVEELAKHAPPRQQPSMTRSRG